MFIDNAMQISRSIRVFAPRKHVMLIWAILILCFLTPNNDLRATGGSGPCLNLNFNCGGYGGGMGTCQMGEFGCSGQCQSSCPSGAGDQYCCGWVGSCVPNVGVCSVRQAYSCSTGLFDPPHCVCSPSGANGNCTRMVC